MISSDFFQAFGRQIEVLLFDLREISGPVELELVFNPDR